ncbi:MAG: Ig-like domain-containing protein, partial [Microthrixaceae bacterium]
MKFFMLACVSMAVAAGCVTPPPTGTPGGPVDLTAPQILTVAVAPAEVAPGQQLTVSATVTDAVGATGVTFVVRGNGMPVGWCGGAATLVGGTAQTGQWELTCTVPAVVNAGTYQVNTLALDAANNPRVIGDGPPSATSGHFTISGATADTEAPVVQSVTVTPSPVVRGNSVTISVHVTDATGVQGVVVQARRAGLAPGWCAGDTLLTSGTATDGVW